MEEESQGATEALEDGETLFMEEGVLQLHLRRKDHRIMVHQEEEEAAETHHLQWDPRMKDQETNRYLQDSTQKPT